MWGILNFYWHREKIKTPPLFSEKVFRIKSFYTLQYSQKGSSKKEEEGEKIISLHVLV